MDWKRVAKEDLRELPYLEHCIESHKAQLAALEADYVSIKANVTSRSPVQGGASKMEDGMIANIMRRDRLNLNYDAAKKRYDLIVAALELLTDEQRMILDRFYVHRQRNHIDRLCDELNIERSEIYRRQDAALRAFTVAMYGITEY